MLNLQVALKAQQEESKMSSIKKESPEQAAQLSAIDAAGAGLEEATGEVDKAGKTPHGHHHS